jgi:hypothetical protein
VRQAWLAKSEYLCKIGDKTNAVTAFNKTFDKTVGVGYRIDLVFNLIRIGIFFMDHDLITINIGRAKELMEKVYLIIWKRGKEDEGNTHSIIYYLDLLARATYYNIIKIPVYKLINKNVL